jgi:shikimate kinase
MKLNEHKKKGCDKVVDDHGNKLKLKLYPPLRNIIESIIIAKGGNVLEYKVKLEALSKPKHSCFIVTNIVPLVQQKRKNEKNPL